MHLTYDRHAAMHRAYARIQRRYGHSPYYTWVPSLVLTHDPKDGYGSFCSFERVIVVNLAACQNMRDAIGTLIHEYRHYMQHPGWYARYENLYGYWDSPFELQANENLAEEIAAVT